MSALKKIAFSLDRRDEVPNQELAQDLAEKKDHKGIGEIAANLWNKEKKIQANCIKVLYEIGYIAPELIGDYSADFLKLLKSPNNRMVWGGMIALSTIAGIKAPEIFKNLDLIRETMEKGSVITVDSGIKALSIAASKDNKYRKKIFPHLLDYLNNCRPKQIPMYAEFVFRAVDRRNKQDYLQVLEKRRDVLKSTQLKRIDKVVIPLKKN